MYRFLIFLFAWLFQLSASAQTIKQTLKISNDIELIRLSDNAYVHVSRCEIPPYGRVASNGLVYINHGKAFLFDTPVTNSQTKDLVTYLQDSLHLKIVGFVPNHWHKDCMGGLSYLKKLGIASYANRLTINIAKSKGLPVPAKGFRHSLQLQLGDKKINCYYFGAAHTLDNIVVWIPSEKILFGGCMVKELASKGLGNTKDADLKAWPHTIDNVIVNFPDARIVIPGHGQTGGLELLQHTKELLDKSK